MTLTTNVLICQPVNPERVLEEVMRLLGEFVDFTPERYANEEQLAYFRDVYGTEVAMTRVGQGLPAWAIVRWGMDRVLEWYDEEELRDIGELRGVAPWWNRYLVHVSFDTGYGWEGPRGGGAGDLHAYLVRELGEWLADQGVEKWVWEDEMTGQWYDGGDDEVENLGDVRLGGPR